MAAKSSTRTSTRAGTRASTKANGSSTHMDAEHDDPIQDDDAEDDDQQEDDGDDDDDDEEALPEITNPYTTLGVAADATDDQIKKAYRKLSLRHHPDKATGADAATAKEDFQRLTAAYALLSDPRRRARFDTTGDTADAIFTDDASFSWADYYRERYADVVTDATIKEFASQYKGSAEERRDVLAAFARVKGKMVRLYELVMLCDMEDDEPRFREIIDGAIANGEVEPYPAYANESANDQRKRLAKAKKDKAHEAHEAEGERQKEQKKSAAKRKKGGDDDLGALAALIRGRQADRGAALLDSLEEKYGGGSRKKQRKLDEPPESAFAANRARQGRK